MNSSEMITKKILENYKSIRFFANEIDVAYTTLKTALDKDNIENMAVGTVIKICEKLGLDVLTFEPKKVDNNDFTQEEQKLIEGYRHLPPNIRSFVFQSISLEGALRRANQCVEKQAPSTQSGLAKSG